MRFFFAWVPRRPLLGFLLALVLCGLGIWRGMSIPIRLSLMDLLPEERESVVYSKEIAKEIGGIGYLLVLVGPVDHPEQYMATLTQEFKQHPELRYTYFERESYIMRDRAPFLLPRRDFDDLLKHSETLIFKGKVGGLLDLGFGDQDEEKTRVTEARDFFDKLKAKYTQGQDNLDGRFERYFLTKDGRYAAFWMKPNFDADLLDRSVNLIGDVQARTQKALPADVPFRLWGRYVNHVRDVTQIKGDIALTGVVSTVAMLLVLLLGMGSFRSAFISIFCVVVSMGWTLGFARLAVGQINIITGFLLAILAGLGVEYGVHLIRRYFQERADGKDSAAAFDVAYWNTGHALFSAALTSAGAFFILAISDFRAFSELGMIAGFGILAIYLTYMLCFPFVFRFLPDRPRFEKGIRFFGIYPFKVTWVWIIPIVMAVVGYGLSAARFEYNFQKMRELGGDTLKANALVNDMMNNRTTTPLALLARDVSQAVAVQRWLEADERKDIIHSALSLGSLVPVDMQERARTIRKFGARLDQVSDAKIKKELSLDPKLIRSWLKGTTYVREDLPPQFRDAFGKDGNILLVYSRASISTYEGINTIVSTLLAGAKEFPGLKVGGDTRIFKEILDHVFKDGKEVLILFLIGTFLLQWLEFRKVRDALELEAQLILGILFLVGLMGALDVPFTIVNIGMIPAVLACGIDIGVHVRHRDEEVKGSPLAPARFVAQAVQLSVLTTLIGFGSLFLAQAAMLKGIAWISVLGQISMYFICMFAWPVGKELYRRLQRRHHKK